LPTGLCDGRTASGPRESCAAFRDPAYGMSRRTPRISPPGTPRSPTTALSAGARCHHRCLFPGDVSHSPPSCNRPCTHQGLTRPRVAAASAGESGRVGPAAGHGGEAPHGAPRCALRAAVSRSHAGGLCWRAGDHPLCSATSLQCGLATAFVPGDAPGNMPTDCDARKDLQTASGIADSPYRHQ
jgi:hypothetical protein